MSSTKTQGQKSRDKKAEVKGEKSGRKIQRDMRVEKTQKELLEKYGEEKGKDLGDLLWKAGIGYLRDLSDRDIAYKIKLDISSSLSNTPSNLSSLSIKYLPFSAKSTHIV